MEEKLKQFLKFLKLNESTVSTVLGMVVVLVVGVLIVNYFRLKPARLPNINQNLPPTSKDIAQTEPFANTPADQLPPYTGELPTSYRVRGGDNLWKIAERFYQTGYAWVEIAAANQLKGDMVDQGQELTIPQLAKAYPLTAPTGQVATGGNATTSAAIATATPTVTIVPTLKPTIKLTSAAKSSPSPTVSVTPTPPTLTLTASVSPTPVITSTPTNRFGPTISEDQYTVVRGDHLWGIATRAYNNGYKWVDIARINKLQNPNLIHAGLQLTLPR